MKKRGQVTLFVILGLILIIAVAIFVYLFTQNQIDDVPDDTKVTYEPEIQPLANDVRFCIKKLGKEVMQDIGVKGGYLETDFYQYDSFNEYNNDAVEIFDESGLIIPYWSYLSGSPDCTNCITRLNIPELEGESELSIQNQAQNYIDDNLEDCVDKFVAYENMFDVSYEEPESTFYFRDKDVFISVDWPINITFPDGNLMPLEKFNDELDLEFRNMYNLAIDVLYQMELFEQERKLEQFTVDIVDYISLGGKDAVIPPREGPTVTEIEAPNIWMLNDVKETLKRQISENIGFVQVFNSRESFYPFTEDPYLENIYTNFQNRIATNNEYLSKTKIRFHYFPSWPMYVRVSPSAGPVIMPESSFVNMLFVNFGYTRYRFDYAISYPVLIKLEDDDAYAGEGYNFQFAYETNIRNSKPYSNETIMLESVENDNFQYGAASQRTVPVKIKVVNGYDLRPIPDVTISYTCGESMVIVGKSVMTNGEAIVDSMLQPCLGGEFSVYDPQYKARKISSDIIIDQAKELTFNVYPEKTFNIKLNKRHYYPTLSEAEVELLASGGDHEIGKDREWQLLTAPNAIYSLIDDEEVSILLTEVEDGLETTNIKFASVSLGEPATIDLTPGTYKLQIISVVKLGDGYTLDKIVIPKREYEVPDDLLSTFGIGSGEKVKIPEVELNGTALVGAILFDNTTSGYIEITEDNLFKTSTVDFYYAGFDVNDLIYAQDLTILEELQKASLVDEELFKPKFS